MAMDDWRPYTRVVAYRHPVRRQLQQRLAAAGSSVLLLRAPTLLFYGLAPPSTSTAAGAGKVISLGGKGSPSPLISLLVRFRLVEDGGRNAGVEEEATRPARARAGQAARGSGGGVWRGGVWHRGAAGECGAGETTPNSAICRKYYKGRFVKDAATPINSGRREY
jgi:hypothetical protein